MRDRQLMRIERPRSGLASIFSLQLSTPTMIPTSAEFLRERSETGALQIVPGSNL
jgi:hypothetical protein